MRREKVSYESGQRIKEPKSAFEKGGEVHEKA